MNYKFSRLENLYPIVSGAFCVIVVISNIISAKMVSLPLFDLSIPAGLITYPLTFLLSCMITEIFGLKKARLMVFIAFGMSILSFGIIEVALLLPTETKEMQIAFHSVLGLNRLRVFASLTAYLVAQIVEVYLYVWIKEWTGIRYLWLRSNGSTFVSQFIDTIIIDILFLYCGLGMEMSQVFPIMIFSYFYKTLFSLVCTPLFYLGIFILRKGLKLSLISQRALKYKEKFVTNSLAQEA